ncbi:hypothetical protein BBJ28_00013890 [Nothophytophthora sp. Chile5]|nr:hypothetical protein BBJ28_00013890 [Nothophytophthora sp. Chile5]
MLLARRCPRALQAPALGRNGVSLAAATTDGLWNQQVRWMGRGPTIQGKKNATDAVRRLPRLVAAVNKAKAANMPKDKIEAAIKRGIETLTDNKRRTAPALRHILGKYNGALGTNGSVSWMFERKGYLEIVLPTGEGGTPTFDEDSLMEITLEAGADDVELREELAQVTCEPSELANVKKSFTAAGLEPAIAELIYNPKEFLDLEGAQLESFEKLLDALNENEDVSEIHHNVNE